VITTALGDVDISGSQMSDATNPVRIEDMLHHAEWARGLARRLLRDRSRVDDVVQDAWVAALRAPPQDPRRIRAWLSRVIRNRVIAMYRYDRVRTCDDLVEEPLDSRQDVVGVVERAEQTRLVVEMVLELPEPYRDVLVLRYMDNLPAKIVAERLGILEATVRSRTFRGLATIRSQFDRRSVRSKSLSLQGDAARCRAMDGRRRTRPWSRSQCSWARESAAPCCATAS